MPLENSKASSFSARVRSAMIWRWGGQALSQIIAWGSTIAVVRMLEPGDYGLFAMTQVVIQAFTIINGYTFATSLIQEKEIDDRKIGQVLGMLLLFNGFIALSQFLLAPYAAAYYGHAEIETLLKVQCLIFLTTPFTALPVALFQRRLEFKSQTYINMGAAIIGALTAFTLAWMDYGVWALVLAPLAMFTSQAIGLTWASKMPLKPVFDFRGAKQIATFGGALTFGQLCWITQTQSDVLIAGRIINPHDLGLYTEALFLTLIITGRFIPPINEVSYPAYAELHKEGKSITSFFLRSIRTVFLVTAPLYIGLALTAEEAVLTIFGAKWAEMAPFVAGLAMAMPAMALQIVCAPATNAIGKTKIYLLTSITGAVVFPCAFLWGVSQGAGGLITAWWWAVPIYLGVTMALTLPAIGLPLRRFLTELFPAAAACAVMSMAVLAAKPYIMVEFAPLKLAILAGLGGISYIAVLWVFWRHLLVQSWAMLRGHSEE